MKLMLLLLFHFMETQRALKLHATNHSDVTLKHEACKDAQSVVIKAFIHAVYVTNL